MSIDERLRTGLARNTDHLLADVEQELETTYARARVRRVGRAALTLAAVAAVATLVVRYGDLSAIRDAEPIAPDPAPRSATDLVGMEGPLEPGTYSMAAWGESRQSGPLPRAVLEVPEGYFSNGGYVVDAGDGITDNSFGEVMVWYVDQVPTDPCGPATTSTQVRPTVDGLAQALVRQRGPSTQPRPVDFAEHQGLQLDVTIPPHMTGARCPNGYTFWPGLTQNRADLVNHLRILDVDGTPLVVLVTDYPDQPDGQLQELMAIAESIHFEPPAR